MKVLAVLFLIGFSNVACAGWIDDLMYDGNAYDGRYAYDSDDEGEAIGSIPDFKFSKDYNDCMDRADSKNDRDHDRCEKDGRGERCHEQSNEQYDKNRASCERVAHVDNVKETGVAFSGSDRSEKGGGANGGKSSGGRESGAGSRDSGR